MNDINLCQNDLGENDSNAEIKRIDCRQKKY